MHLVAFISCPRNRPRSRQWHPCPSRCPWVWLHNTYLFLLVFIMCVISVCLCLFVSPSTVQSSSAQINYIYNIMLIIYIGRQVALHVDTRWYSYVCPQLGLSVDLSAMVQYALSCLILWCRKKWQRKTCVSLPIVPSVIVSLRFCAVRSAKFFSRVAAGLFFPCTVTNEIYVRSSPLIHSSILQRMFFFTMLCMSFTVVHEILCVCDCIGAL